MQNTENYELDPNFAVVCSFVEKFGEFVCTTTKDLSIEGLKTFLESTEVDKKDPFFKFHVSLIRGVLGYCTPDTCEKLIIKFCKDFADGDDAVITKLGYGNAPVTVKLRILKNLCEDQFQYNDRFNRRVNEILDEESCIRHEPVGKDKLGRSYWFMLDTSSGLRLFRGWHNELTCDETWNVVCREISELKELIALLEENETLTNEDKSFRVQPYQPSPKKISPTKQLPVANDAAKALYFSSIASSPRFIKSPQHRRSKLEIRRDERKHKLPHCRVKLSRLKKHDIDKWKAKPYLAPGTDKKGKLSLLTHESVVDSRSDKIVKSEKETGNTPVHVALDYGKVNVKTETIVSSLKHVVKEDKDEFIDKTERKVNEIKTDSSESIKLCPVKITEQTKGKIKCALKTENDATANVTIHEKPYSIKGEEHVICKSAQSTCSNDDSQNLSETCSGESVAVPRVKTEHSDVNTMSVSNAIVTEKSKSSDVTVNDKNVPRKKTKRREKPKHSDNVSDDLGKFPKEAVSVINEKGDASSYRNADCEVLNDKTAAGDRNVINSAANAQDPKETISTDEKKTENESDIFNAAIQELLTLESNVIGSSGMNKVLKQDKGSGAKTAAGDVEHTDTSENVEEVKDTLKSAEKLKDDLEVNNTLDNVETIKDTSESVEKVKDTSEHVEKVKDTSEHVEHVEKLKDTSESVEKVKDTSESDKKVLDKALKDLIQLEMMTKGSTVDKVSATKDNGLLDKDPASKPIKEMSEASNTAATEVETSVDSESISDKTNHDVDQKSIAAVNTKSDCAISEVGVSNSSTENEVNKEKEKILTPKKIVIFTHVNADEKPNALREALSTKPTQSPHKSWANLHSADTQTTQNVRNNSNVVIPSKSCDNQLNAGDFMSKVMNLIHDGGSVKSASDEMDKTKGNSMKTKNLKASVDGDKVEAEKDINLLVGDEMVRIEVACNSSSDTESDDEGTEKTKAGNTTKEKSVSKTKTPTKAGLNMEKAAINSLYTNSKSVTKSDSVVSSPRTLKKQTPCGVPTILVQKPLKGQNSSTPIVQKFLLPAHSGMSIPNTVSYTSLSHQSQASNTVNVVHVRPKSSLISVLKSPPLTAPPTSTPVILAPFNTLPTVGNQIQLLSGKAAYTSQLQTVTNKGLRPAVTSLPQGSKFLVTNVPIAPARNPTTYKLPLLSQTLGTSQPLSFSMAAQQPTITSLLYVNNKPTKSINDNSTVKLALKKHLEAPVGKMFVSNDKGLKKTAKMYIGPDGIHRDAVSHQPIVHPPNMSYVIAGPGGKYYDKATGYVMDIPECNNFQHVPGKVYLAADAKFANGVKKTQQATKKKSKKKKFEEEPDTSDEEFEKLLESSGSEDDGGKSESSDEDYDYEQISKRVKTAKNLKLPSRRASVESVESEDDTKLEDEDLVPIVLGRNAKRAADRQLNNGEDKKDDTTDEENDDDIGSCKVCGSSKQPTTILLCDDCDDGYHMLCLSPPLSVVPLEDWFCPSCQHNMLVAALKEKLELAKKAYRRVHRSKRTISPTAFSINSSNIMEVERRSCRERKEVSYDEKKYDKMVVDAVKEMNSVKKRKLSSGSSSSSDEEEETMEETNSNKKKSKSVRSTKIENYLKGSKKENEEKKTGRPTRATRSETKLEDKESSTSSKKHKRSRLSYTEPVSDDSGSEYVQSDHSSCSDQEESVPDESPVKKTYLTLSGRATKNVSYK